MKRGHFVNSSQPTVRILLVSHHLYQVSFRNIYGYLKAVLIDRCKKVGAQYRHFEKSYFVPSDKLSHLKKEFQNVLAMKNSDNKINFRIQDFPLTNIKCILRPQKKNDEKEKSKNRLIFIDKSSKNRYFYMKQRVQDLIDKQKTQSLKRQIESILIFTSQANKRLWISKILLNKSLSGNIQNLSSSVISYEIIELTYSQLTTKKSTVASLSKILQLTKPMKIFLITYDNMKFLQNSWFLQQMSLVSQVFVDDAEFLLMSESQISTLENKTRNFQSFKILMKSYNLANQLIIFLNKIPQPTDLFQLLVILKPKLFTRLKFSSSLSNNFNKSTLIPQDKIVFEQFAAWFKRRYRTQNKCFKEIIFLLNCSIIKRLDQNLVNKKFGYLPILEISQKFKQNYKLTLIELPSEIIQRFRSMDKKYKKLNPSINFKQILQNLHNVQKNEQKRFQLLAKIQDHLSNKQSKNYLSQARQLMLSSKFELILRRLYFTINSQKQRIVVVLEDQKLEKRLKKYLKETQIQYVDYDIINQKSQKVFSFSYLHSKTQNYPLFDSNFSTKVCIINTSRILMQYRQIQKNIRQKTKKQNLDNYKTQQLFGYENQYYNANISIPKITTAESVHFVDSFWNQFNWEKENIYSQIFDFQLSYIQQLKVQSSTIYQQKFRKPKIIQNFFITEGSYEKMMLQNYLTRKQQVLPLNKFQNENEDILLTTFYTNMILVQNQKFSQLKCQTIEYLDIDEEYDKVEEQAKRLKNSKDIHSLEQKVFLPKYTKPQTKSFKQLIEQKLLNKNIQDILEESEQFKYVQKKQNQLQDQNHKTQQQIIQNPRLLDNLENDKNTQNSYRLIHQECSQAENNENSSQTLEESLQFKIDKSNLKKPQIQVQTIKLQFNAEKLVEVNSSSKNNQKDLFDDLLGEDFQQKNYKQSYQKDQSLFEQAQTQPEFKNNNDILTMKSRKIKNQYFQVPVNTEELLLSNFGYEAYYGKLQQTKQITKQINTQIKNNSSKKLSKQYHWPISQSVPERIKPSQQTKQINKKDASIEVIECDEAIDVQKINIPVYKTSQNYKRKFVNHRVKLTPSQRAACFQPPKINRMCSKKMYEEAISKSKQLWEKKLRKQKQHLILPPKKLQVNLTPKANWKQNLTSKQIEQLRKKGIQI